MQIDLKAYTTRAKELEAAIYTQRNLMTSYETEIVSQTPKAPVEKNISAPQKPVKPFEPTYCHKFPAGLFTVYVIGFISFFFVWLSCITSDDRHIGVQFMEIVWFLGGALCAYLGYEVLSEKSQATKNFEKQKSEYERDNSNYPMLLDKYKREYKKYQEEQEQASRQYEKDYERYLEESDQFNKKFKEITDKHNEVYSSLVSALESLYDENVIFPKYRNLVAISAINEYLLSGRCDKLEGPDGAYNLYEMELRQNIIIGQLSNIIGNLEEIKDNQYSLYQELRKSNQTVDEIICEIRNMRYETKLIAYFTGVTALVETSPKYYYGITM